MLGSCLEKPPGSLIGLDKYPKTYIQTLIAFLISTEPTAAIDVKSTPYEYDLYSGGVAMSISCIAGPR